MNDPGRENELKSFDMPLKIGLAKSSDASARIAPKSGRFQFDAASKKFKALTNPSQIELSVENLRPLAKKECVQGRVMIIEFSKPTMQHNQLLLSELTETDKQLIHKCMLKLVGVHRGKINKTAPSGNKRPYPGQNWDNAELGKRPPQGPANGGVDGSIGRAWAYAAPPRPRFNNDIPPNLLLPLPRGGRDTKTANRAKLSEISLNKKAEDDDNMNILRPKDPPNILLVRRSPLPRVGRDTKTANRAKLSEISLNKKEEDDVNMNILRPKDEVELPEKYTLKEEDDNMNILRPEDEVELPEKYTLNDFWISLKKDEKIRSGMRGEWIKGQDEHLTVEGLLCLKDGEWMNADMMDAYLSFTSKRPEIQRVRYIPTYALLSYNRTKKIPSEWYWQLKEADIVLVPAHLNNNHWAMAVVDIPNRTIQMMDSMNNGFMGETKRKFMETILDILYNVAEQQNVMEYLGERGEWTRDELLDVPQQKNGTDCGIFALLFGRFSAERRPLNFDQRHIPYYRRRICYDIVATIH